MSRVGRQPISIPQGVEIKIEDKKVKVKGKKGELETLIPRDIKVDVKDGEIIVSVEGNLQDRNAFWGLTRSLVNNMVIGVTDGFSKTLEIRGREYRVNLKGKDLEFDLGYSHPIKIAPKNGIEFKVEDNKVTVSGIDKALVGEQAAEIRDLRPAEVYKGKGIRYDGEYVIHKEGKRGL
ncbi:MAG: 50S ribosomal protein L6 [candidate division WOR-3 bacterium]|jgi:large subunit ribosomal protein L6